MSDIPRRPPLPPAADPSIGVIDAIIAEAYSERQAEPVREHEPPAGFPKILPLPDYLILAPSAPGDHNGRHPVALDPVRGADCAHGAAAATNGKATSPENVPAASGPALPARERTSERIAALEGLTLLEPFSAEANATALPEVPLPPVPAPAAEPPAPTSRATDRPMYFSERDAALAGLPLLQPLEDASDGAKTD